MRFFETIVNCTINWSKGESILLTNDIIDVGKLKIENKAKKKY